MKTKTQKVWSVTWKALTGIVLLMCVLGGAILGHGLNEEKGGKIGGVVGGVICAAATTSLIASAPVVLGVCAASAAVGYGLGCWMDKSPETV